MRSRTLKCHSIGKLGAVSNVGIVGIGSASMRPKMPLG